jgi:hypothetical protein
MTSVMATRTVTSNICTNVDGASIDFFTSDI